MKINFDKNDGKLLFQENDDIKIMIVIFGCMRFHDRFGEKI